MKIDTSDLQVAWAAYRNGVPRVCMIHVWGEVEGMALWYICELALSLPDVPLIERVSTGTLRGLKYSNLTDAWWQVRNELCNMPKRSRSDHAKLIREMFSIPTQMYQCQ